MSTVLDPSKGFTPLTDKQERTVYTPEQVWTDDFAVKVAVQDFQNAESYRTQNQDWKWRNADEMFLAWVQQKYWEGSRVPRASIGVYLAFAQIQAVLAKLMSAFFDDPEWFDSVPLGPTTAAQAREWRAMLADQLDNTRVREMARRTFQSGLIYGNGVAKLSWVSQESMKQEWRVRWNRVMNGYERVLDKSSVKSIENKPEFDNVAIQDFYIDPNCASPMVQDGRFYAIRKLASVDDLDILRGVEPFKIPSKGDLIELALQKPSTQGDTTKSTIDLFRLGQWAPQNDTTVDPGGKRLELVEYCTKDRMVIVANRQMVIVNMPNSFGFMPAYDFTYADVPNRFYGLGICEILEGEQRLQQSILNARLDELALSIHRPMIKRKSSINTPVSMMRNRPGQVWEVENPKEDIVFLDVPNITADSHIETQASDVRSQKTTGVSDMAVLGVPSAGGNSANRTATGVGAQAAASASRIEFLVGNAEDTFFNPMLNDLVKLNQLFPPIGTPQAEAIALSQVRIRMRASAKMRSKMALMHTLPMILQVFGNSGFNEQLAMQGATVDWKEMSYLITDMTGARLRADLIRPLTDEEKKMRADANGQQDKIRMEMQQQRILGQYAIQKEKIKAEEENDARDREDTADQDNLYVLSDVLKTMIPAVMKKDEKKKND